MDSLARASRDANVDPPRRHLGVFLLAHEVELGGPDIGVAGELAHLVQRGAVADGVVNRRLAERVNADAPAAQPVGIDARGPAVLLDQPPGGLRSRCRRSSPVPSGFRGRNSGPSLSSPMPARSRYARTGRAASSRILRRFLFRLSVTWR